MIASCIYIYIYISDYTAPLTMKTASQPRPLHPITHLCVCVCLSVSLSNSGSSVPEMFKDVLEAVELNAKATPGVSGATPGVSGASTSTGPTRAPPTCTLEVRLICCLGGTWVEWWYTYAWRVGSLACLYFVC